LNNPEIGNMPYDPEKHHRRSIRLKGYDYTRAGAYFITIVTQNRVCLFGAVVEGRMRLNPLGQIVQECWLAIPDHFPHALLDEFVIMPNHLHGIIVLQEMENSVGARHVPRRRREEFGKPVPGSIPTIVRSFKSAATKHINEYRGTPARRSGNATTTNTSSATTAPCTASANTSRPIPYAGTWTATSIPPAPIQ
jgi:putative transposase